MPRLLISLTLLIGTLLYAKELPYDPLTIDKAQTIETLSLTIEDTERNPHKDLPP